jgi:hypothetical protein
MTHARTAPEHSRAVSRACRALQAALAALVVTACGPPPRERPPPPPPPTGEFVLAENLPPPGEAAPPVTKTLADLVPEGAASVPDRGFDATGRFDCIESIEAQPEEERPGCLGSGYVVRARILFTTDARGRAETPKLVETPFVEHLDDCGATRSRIYHPPRDFLSQRFRGVSLSVPRRSEPPQLAVTPCRDARVVFEHPSDVEHALNGVVHRFTSPNAMATVSLHVGNDELRSWILGPEQIPDPCAPETMLALPWTLEIEVLCAGDVAVVAAGVWRDRETAECAASGAVSPATPVQTVPCDLDKRAGTERVTSGYERFQLNLANGSIRTIELPEVTVRSAPE